MVGATRGDVTTVDGTYGPVDPAALATWRAAAVDMLGHRIIAPP
jgi:hypothetical protein